ncbi:MAG TPA: hypothetical protein VJ732_12910 [Bryobacteraceae bacterium]|nr:hypothetical protein [Bryobacteraceae bacterium]
MRGFPTRRLILPLQVASLLATGWVVWNNVMIPRLPQNSLGSLLFQPLLYCTFAWLWSAVITLMLYGTLVADRAEMLIIILRTSSAAVWFAPAMILTAMFSPAAMIAALVLVFSATRLLYSQWLPAGIQDTGERRSIAPALAVSFGFQAGLWRLGMKDAQGATALFVMSTAVLTALSISSGAYQPAKTPSLPRAILGVVLTLFLAAGLTLGGFIAGGGGASRGWNFGYRPPAGLIATVRDLLRGFFDRPQPTRYPAATARAAPPLPGSTLNLGLAGFPGVILWPEIKPETTLVAPLPADGVYGPGLTRPLSIPFSGEIWMFKWPFSRPPLSSFFQRGNTADLAFSTVDHTKLEMEAHQKLDPPVDLRCCSKIQMDVVNRDRYPGTVSLELIVISRNDRLLPLGTVLVGPAVYQTLDFQLPVIPPADCKELKVVFHRSTRDDRSARVAIERFVLVPRGGLR